MHPILPFEMQDLPWLQYFCLVSTERMETERSGTSLCNLLQSLERIVLTHSEKRNITIWHSKRKINRKNLCIFLQAHSGTQYILEIGIHTICLSERSLTGLEQDLT